MATALTLPFGDPAFSALQALLSVAKTGDPLAPVTVVAPSNYAGLSLRRILGAGGLVNVRFLVLDRVAELLGAPALAAHRRPLGAWQRSEAIRAALAGHTGVFHAVAAHPATVRALAAAFRDLRAAQPGALDELAAQSRRGADVVALFRRFRELTRDSYEVEDLAEAAAVAVHDGASALRDLGRMILYLPRALTPARATLVRALLEHGHADVIFGRSGEPAVDLALSDCAAQLGLALGAFEVLAPLPSATAILRAVDAEEEVRGVVRLVLGAVKAGTPLYRIGVLFGSPAEYAGLVHEQFTAAGIPVNGPPLATLAETMPGRLLLGLLALPEANFRRSVVMEWLTSGPIRLLPEGGYPNAHRWDEVSRDAGVVKGLGQWRSRLQAWATGPRRRDSDAMTASALASFVEELADRLEPPAPLTAAGLAIWTLALLDRYLGSELVAANWESSPDSAAYSAVRQVLTTIAAAPPVIDPGSGAAFAPFAGLSPVNARRQFTAILVEALTTPAIRQGAFGDGVFCGSINNARGMTFDHVFVAGMVEGAMPPAAREDAVLPDVERGAAGLPQRESRRIDSREDYLAALASAPRRTLCFAQSSLRAQARQLPSRWLLESASLLEFPPPAAGGELSSEEFLRLGPRPWLTSVASFEAALASASLEGASLQEWELRSLRSAAHPERHFLTAETALGRGFEAATARLPRWSRRFHMPADSLSPFAGGVGQAAALDESRVYSPTSLETFATCGFRYFLKDVVRVKTTERPEDLNRISGADRGNVIHDSLERFLSEVHANGRSPGPGEKWTRADRDRLLEIGGEECARANARGVTGAELLWRIDQARIRRDLTLFLESDNDVRAETGASFFAAERAFRSPDRDAVPGDSWRPVTIDLGETTSVRFAGRIDRVDRRPDGSLIVYDYKTGRADDFKSIDGAGDHLNGGRALQLPIYALAARQSLGQADTPVESYYWFVSERERFGRIGYSLTPEDEAGLRTTLGVLARTADAGLFPPVPGKRSGRPSSYDNCRYCDFDRVCSGGDRLRAWEEYKGTPGLAPYVALSGGPATQPQGVPDVG